MLKQMQFKYSLGIMVTISAGLIGCSSADITSDAPPKAERLRMGDVLPAGPSHELRLFVSPDGTPTGMEVVRIKSFRKDFKPKGSEGAGKRLEHVPPRAMEIASKLNGRADVISLVIFEQPEGRRRPIQTLSDGPSASALLTSTGSFVRASAVRQDDDPPELPWFENPDAFEWSEHEAYVDAGLQEIVAIGDDTFAQYPIPEPDPSPEPVPSVRLGSSVMFPPSAIASGTVLLDDPLALALSMENCAVKKAVVITGGVALAAGVVIAVGAYAAAAAPVAFTIGGISGMALPSAASVIGARVGIVSTLAAGVASYVDSFMSWLDDC